MSEGAAAGEVYPAGVQGETRAASPEEVRQAFAAVSAERTALAERLHAEGRDQQADIVTVGALIALDPALVEPAVAAVAGGCAAPDAVRESAGAQAAILAALPNPDLAARADDVRQVANAVLAQLAAGQAAAPPAGDFILVQREVDPADLIRLSEDGLVGAVSVSGSANSHASIIARGLGLPMLASADPAVLEIPAGRAALLDATAGQLTTDPAPQDLAALGHGPGAGGAHPGPAQSGPAQSGPAQSGAAAAAGTPHRTADGQPVTLLCNAASAREIRIGLSAGAAGAGLIRTEIPFVNAAGWPSEADHRAALDPLLGLLAGRPAVVRLLDFSGDKIPPFLAGTQGGLDALLGQPQALGDQLRAAVASGRDTQLKIMVPMVARLDQMDQVGAALADAVPAGAAVPPLGMMVEVAATAAAAAAFAPAAGFFSIGTNDLSSEVLGLSRADPRMGPALAADPRVLALISRVVAAAATTGIEVSVCGDAGADPGVLPLLIGLGVRTFSVGAARLPQVAGWVATADTARCADLAAAAMSAPAGPPAADQVRADAGPS
ncbi:MAG: putative PEP-binding protein [Streptosporangiaceae bacterium]